MRRLIVAATLSLSTGCAALPPSLSTAGDVAREVACVVCQTAGGPSERARDLADGLERLTRIVAEVAAARSPEEVRRILGELARGRERDRALWDRLVDLAGGGGGR